MTEDTSPENLRKFLESDDPALVQLGLSMTKGIDFTEEFLPTILGRYMWGDDKTVRAISKSFFNKYASEEIQAKVKENWKASYRTLSMIGDKYPEIVKTFLEAFVSQDDFAVIALEPLIKALHGDNYWMVRRNAVITLGKIGGKRAVEPLIKALEDKNRYVNYRATTALGDIGDKRAVEPLIKALEDNDEDDRDSTAIALGKIGDKRVVEPLIKALEDKEEYVRQSAAKALRDLGDDIRNAATDALKKLGHEVE